MGYKLKKEFSGKGSVTHFSKPVKGIGFSLNLDTATEEQLESAYLMGCDFVEKTEDLKK